MRVRNGQQVKAGDALGLVGLSGETQFPHLHINVMKGDVHLDPFSSTASTTACDASAANGAPQLWAPPVAYQPTSLINDGVTPDEPAPTQALDLPPTPAMFPASSPTLTYWVQLLNVKAGDILKLTITRPDGHVMGKLHSMRETQAQFFSAVLMKGNGGSIAPGTYQLHVTLTRDGKALVNAGRSITVQ